jgi:hypothetical protein
VNKLAVLLIATTTAMALLADEQKKVADDILAPLVNAQNALDVVALKKKTEDAEVHLAAL